MNKNNFYNYVINKYESKDCPEGDFAEGMQYDKDLPKNKDDKDIFKYLDFMKHTAMCSDASTIYDELKLQYLKIKGLSGNMYFITTIDSKTDDKRCVGYYSTFERAEEAVLDNACDLNETCYDYVIIEEVEEGLYQYDFDAKWYKWNDIDEIYEKIERKPEKYKKQVGFGIG